MNKDDNFINEIRKQLQELSKKQNLLEEKLDELLKAGSYADEAMSRLSDVESRMDGVESEVGDISACDLDSRVNNLETEGTELLSKFENLEINSDDHESDIRRAEDRISEVEKINEHNKFLDGGI